MIHSLKGNTKTLTTIPTPADLAPEGVPARLSYLEHLDRAVKRTCQAEAAFDAFLELHATQRAVGQLPIRVDFPQLGV